VKDATNKGNGLVPQGGAPYLEFRDVLFAYGAHTVVENLTLKVERGEFAAILGPNGSGKTTLLKLALGLLTPSRGEVLIIGSPPEKFREWGRVGYVPQRLDSSQADYPATAFEVVAQGLYRGPDPLAFLRLTSNAKVTSALGTVGVADLERKKFSALSVGQRQRVMLARALVREPDLLVLDEPVAGVDIAAEERFYALLRRLNRERGITIILVTHDIGATMSEATTVACINRTLVFHGPAHAITHHELSALYGIPMEVLLHNALHEHR